MCSCVYIRILNGKGSSLSLSYTHTNRHTLAANRRVFILHVILKEPFIIISSYIECDAMNTQPHLRMVAVDLRESKFVAKLPHTITAIDRPTNVHNYSLDKWTLKTIDCPIRIR